MISKFHILNSRLITWRKVTLMERPPKKDGSDSMRESAELGPETRAAMKQIKLGNTQLLDTRWGKWSLLLFPISGFCLMFLGWITLHGAVPSLNGDLLLLILVLLFPPFILLLIKSQFYTTLGFTLLLFCIVGFVLGILGLFQDRSKVRAIVGTLLWGMLGGIMFVLVLT